MKKDHEKITLCKVSIQGSKSPKFSRLRGWSPYESVGKSGFFSTQIGQKGIEEHVLALTGWKKTGLTSHGRIPEREYNPIKSWSEGSTIYYILESIENPENYLHIKSEFVKVSPKRFAELYSNTTIKTEFSGQISPSL